MVLRGGLRQNGSLDRMVRLWRDLAECGVLGLSQRIIDAMFSPVHSPTYPGLHKARIEQLVGHGSQPQPAPLLINAHHHLIKHCTESGSPRSLDFYFALPFFSSTIPIA